jgi:hypothetical protein
VSEECERCPQEKQQYQTEKLMMTKKLLGLLERLFDSINILENLFMANVSYVKDV